MIAALIAKKTSAIVLLSISLPFLDSAATLTFGNCTPRYSRQMSQPQQGANKGDDVHHALLGPHTPRVGNHDAAAKQLENLVEKTMTEHNGELARGSEQEELRRTC